MGGFVLVAGLGVSHAASVDDDDWHTEADRPVALEQQIKDLEDIQAIVGVKPQREQVYAPRPTLQTVPIERYIESAYQTASVDRPR
jgi:hypothetical protein